MLVYVGMFFSVIDTWSQITGSKRTRMLNERIIAKETEKKTSDALAAVLTMVLALA